MSLLGRRPNWAKSVLYLDRGVLIINKPTGLVCQYNRQKKDVEDTAETGVDLHEVAEDIKTQFDLKNDPLPLHRLDKLTTGALALALTPQSARDASEQFSSHTVAKQYLALVRGGAASFSERSGTIRGPLYFTEGRASVKDDKQWDKRSIAETDWELLASSPQVPLSLVKLSPYTGCKHQLRIHMAKILKTPVLGDTFYATSKLSKKITDAVDIPKDHMYLHSSQLSFYRYLQAGPNKRLRMTFSAPLPSYFVRLCHRIGIPLSSDLIHGGLWVESKRAPPRRVMRSPEHAAEPREEDAGEEPEVHATLNGDNILEQLSGRWLGHGPVRVKSSSSTV